MLCAVSTKRTALPIFELIAQQSCYRNGKEDILRNHTKLLYVAPESLTKRENIDFLKQFRFAIDEAAVFPNGDDFRPEYRKIRSIINEIGVAPVIALTATATPKVQHDIQKTA